IARGLLDARAVEGELGVAHVDDAVAADEPEEGVTAAAVLEVALEGQGEAGLARDLGVVEEPEDDVVDVAPVLPVALAAECRDAVRAVRAGGSVDAGEQMDEQVAGDG